MGSMGTDLGTVGEEDDDEEATAGAVQIPQRRNRPDNSFVNMLSAVSTNPARAADTRTSIH